MTSFLASLETRDTRGAGSEPEWMPTAAQVERERARMARSGVLASLSRAGASTLPPIQTPWLWWFGAAAWVVLWPALITLRAAGQIRYVPWWLLPLLALAHMLALAWPVLRAGHASDANVLRRRLGQVQTLAQMLALEPPEFEVWASLLFQMMGYSVRNTPDSGDHGIDLEVASEQLGLGLVQCKRYRGVVGEPTVRDLYGTLVAAGAGRAWLLTTGGISRQAREWAAGKPIELLDGPALVALARNYR